jgi:hypothetical protein
MNKVSWKSVLFYEFSLETRVPADHRLRSIDRFVDSLFDLPTSHHDSSALLLAATESANIVPRNCPPFSTDCRALRKWPIWDRLRRPAALHFSLLIGLCKAHPLSILIEEIAGTSPRRHFVRSGVTPSYASLATSEER